jgi:hypothetical protein
MMVEGREQINGHSFGAIVGRRHQSTTASVNNSDGGHAVRLQI